MRIQTAPLTKQEFIGLMRMAQNEARTPNEQLRYLLRRALLGDCGNAPGQTKSETADAKFDEVAPTNWKKFFTERELKEIEFCWLYLSEYRHGTNGHNERIIIGKFAALMEANHIEVLPPLPGDVGTPGPAW